MIYNLAEKQYNNVNNRPTISLMFFFSFNFVIKVIVDDDQRCIFCFIYSSTVSLHFYRIFSKNDKPRSYDDVFIWGGRGYFCPHPLSCMSEGFFGVFWYHYVLGINRRVNEVTGEVKATIFIKGSSWCGVDH